MKVYKCDICGEVIKPKWEITIQHWFTKFDICCNCWSKFVKFKNLNKKDGMSEEECQNKN